MNSNGKRFTLTSRFDDLVRLYIYECKSTVDIGKLFNVSSSAVQELLIKRGYSRSYRYNIHADLILKLNQHLKTNDKNEIYEKFSEEIKNTKVGYITHVIQKCKLNLIDYSENKYKISNSLLDKIKHELTSYNVSFVSSRNKVSYQLVNKIRLDFNLHYKLDRQQEYQSSYRILDNDLLDLYKKYKSCNVISSEVLIPANILRERLKGLGIQFGIPNEYKKLLLNKQWCEDAYEKHKYHTVIAETLLNNSCGPDIVSYYIHYYHNIPKKAILADFYPILLSKNKLEELYKGTSIKYIANRLGCSEWVVKHQLEKLKIPIKKTNHTSIGEKNLCSIIKTYFNDVIENDRKCISPSEIDILIPSRNIGIEYCGIYYHSTNFPGREDYHRKKLLKCNNKGIELITVYENEWLEKPNIVKSMILSRLDFSETEIKYLDTRIDRISYNDYSNFLYNNSFIGEDEVTVSYGIFYNEELISIMGFKRLEDKIYEIYYCHSKNIQNGFSKLINYFIKNYPVKMLYSKVDLRWFGNDNVYTQNGFIKDSEIDPEYKLIRRCELLNSNEFGKIPMDHLYRIYDCGSIRYKLEIDKSCELPWYARTHGIVYT